MSFDWNADGITNSDQLREPTGVAKPEENLKSRVVSVPTSCATGTPVAQNGNRCYLAIDNLARAHTLNFGVGYPQLM